MRNLKLIAFVGLGFLTIQSCAKKSELCECTDHATEMMKGDRESKYDGTFQKKFAKEHKALEDKCRKLFGAKKDKAATDKMRADMKECDGYEEFQDETVKSLEHLKTIYPDMAPEIDKSIKEVKGE
jgi:hypothetical protein